MKLRTVLTLLLCCAALTSCSSVQNSEKQTKSVFAMDTVMDLTAYGENAAEALNKVEAEAKRLDALLSRGSDGSEIYKLNQSGSGTNAETAGIIRSALDISSQTDGAFDITIAPVMDLWGFFTKDFHVPSNEELKNALEKVNYKNVTANGDTIKLNGGAQLDLGGIAKGYLSGRMIDIFKESGVKSAIISLGGNVQCLGTKPDGTPWKIAIQHPSGDGFIGTLSAADTAVITSGGYQRFFERDGTVYHHIIDPKIGTSAHSGLKSVTIITPDSTRADGLSTAVYVMGLEKAAELWRGGKDFDMVLMTDDDKVYVTEGIAKDFKSEFEVKVID
ncbi:MAG: FAD:protein FMN transferase [Clostridia bacterium]|nr:FAD:protein FMN transferase [Clostridia bacterium]